MRLYKFDKTEIHEKTDPLAPYINLDQIRRILTTTDWGSIYLSDGSYVILTKQGLERILATLDSK